MNRTAFGILALALPVILPGLARAEDWPQWRGPERTGISREIGLLTRWPEGGPKKLWTVKNVGTGYGTPSIAGGRVYVMGYVGGEEAVLALDEASGALLWSTGIAPANRRGKGYAEGSRSTPTVDGNRLFALGDSGDLVCLDATTGKKLWKRDLVDDFRGRVPGWGYSESPLFEDGLVIVTPGGPSATMVALRAGTGEVAWTCSAPAGGGAHYSSPITATIGGVKQYVQFMGGGAIGVEAKTGKLLWHYGRHNGVTANIATPLVKGNQVMLSAAYGMGSGLIDLNNVGEAFKATEVYYTNQLKSKHGGLVLLGDYVYGFDDPGTLVCMDWKTGKVIWSDRSVSGNASICYADGHFYARSQRGTIALIEASSRKYVEVGRFDPPDRTSKEAWAHPVVANGRLFLRDQDVLHCYDVKQR